MVAVIIESTFAILWFIVGITFSYFGMTLDWGGLQAAAGGAFVASVLFSIGACKAAEEADRDKRN